MNTSPATVATTSTPVFGAAILGSAEVLCTALPTIDASSSLGLEVERWAAKPARLARMDRLCALALVACDGALVAAGLSPDGPDWTAERTGIVLGTAFGCHATNEAYYRGYLHGGIEQASPRLFAYTLPSSPVGEISIHHRILGPASTAVGGLTAAIDALREALRHLDAGRAERMLVAGVDITTTLLARLGVRGELDAAAALVLGPPRAELPRVTAAATRHASNDPLEAAQAVVRAVLMQRRDRGPLAITRVVAPERLLPMACALIPLAAPVALDERAHGAAPIIALRAAAAEVHDGATLVLAADPIGQAGALLLER